MALQSKGHQVVIYTAHHDPQHSFPPTRDGTLRVIVYGDWLPTNIFRRFHLPCALLRFFYLSFRVVWAHRRNPLDLFFVDQISATIPLLKLTGTKVLFYCHFPDQLLASSDSLLKRCYRLPLNYLEEITTGAADRIFVNSKFTSEVFGRTFRRISQKPIVLYPTVNASSLVRSKKLARNFSEKKFMILSLNRFERKKNIGLALEAFAYLKTKEPQITQNAMLVVAGGYDSRVDENVQHLEELKEMAIKLNIRDCVQFLTSPTDEERNRLFGEALCVLYTPQNEHFGIVPLEAAFASVPVIACNSGGPRETIEHEKTGFLCEPTAQSFAEALRKLITNPELVQEMGAAARQRAQQLFSFESFVERLNSYVVDLFSFLDTSSSQKGSEAMEYDNVVRFLPA